MAGGMDGHPASPDEAKAGRRMQYFNEEPVTRPLFLLFLFDRLDNLP